MKLKTMKKLLIILLPIILLVSCSSSPKRESDALKKIKIPYFPEIIDEDGNPRAEYNRATNKEELEPDYWLELIKYGLEVEAAAQALEALK